MEVQKPPRVSTLKRTKYIFQPFRVCPWTFAEGLRFGQPTRSWNSEEFPKLRWLGNKSKSQTYVGLHSDLHCLAPFFFCRGSCFTKSVKSRLIIANNRRRWSATKALEAGGVVLYLGSRQTSLLIAHNRNLYGRQSFGIICNFASGTLTSTLLSLFPDFVPMNM